MDASSFQLLPFQLKKKSSIFNWALECHLFAFAVSGLLFWTKKNSVKPATSMNTSCWFTVVQIPLIVDTTALFLLGERD